jgi:hypothetical protein
LHGRALASPRNSKYSFAVIALVVLPQMMRPVSTAVPRNVTGLSIQSQSNPTSPQILASVVDFRRLLLAGR